MKLTKGESSLFETRHTRADESDVVVLRASSYEPGNRAGSVTGTNSVLCVHISWKFQPGRPG